LCTYRTFGTVYGINKLEIENIFSGIVSVSKPAMAGFFPTLRMDFW
jgi:hypothetical protein